MKGTTMKYRAKRNFLSVTKGMEFPTNEYGDICFNVTWRNGMDSGCCIDPERYPDDFELVEEPKYTDSDLDCINGLFNKCWAGDVTVIDAVKQAIAELKQSKEKK